MLDDKNLLIWIGRIRTAFNDNFENNWFWILIDDVPLDPVVLKDIRDFLRIDETWAVDRKRALEGIKYLELFIETIRKFLLPCIREKLRISNLNPQNRVMDRDQKAIRGLVACALPLKVKILEDLVQGFRRELEEPTEQAAASTVSASV